MPSFRTGTVLLAGWLLPKRGAHAARAYVGGNGLHGNVPWCKLLTGLVIVYGAWLGYHRFGAVFSTPVRGSLSIEQLAASASPGDVVM